MLNKRTAFVIGRFQPFHRGHIKLITACKDFDQIIVFIGSTEQKPSLKNPLSFEQRKLLIEETLRTFTYLPKITYISLPDTQPDALWFTSILIKLREEGAVNLFQDTTFVCFDKDAATTAMNDFLARHSVKMLRLKPNKKTKGISATDVRSKIRNGTSLEDIVELHPKTVTALRKFGLVDVIHKTSRPRSLRATGS